MLSKWACTVEKTLYELMQKPGDKIWPVSDVRQDCICLLMFIAFLEMVEKEEIYKLDWNKLK